MLISSLINFWASIWGSIGQLSWSDTPATTAFGYNETTFLLHGEPLQIIGGEMDPQRIPHQYWRHRLQTAKAMGINTIFSYVYWDRFEPVRGQWSSNSPSENVARFFEIAQEEGLWVVLRPGPYACGEHDFGGFPFWLPSIPGLTIRDNNEPFLTETERYVSNLSNDIGYLQITNGGPILMVQIENEYGSYADNHEYVKAARDILKKYFDVPLFTNDGGVSWTLDGGSTPGALAIIDGDPYSGFKARDEYVTDPSRLGPLVDGEYYTFAADIWGSNQAHQTTANSPETVDKIVKEVRYILDQGASLNFYMLHGGTNFGFDNGALWQNRSSVFITSYDFGAPIDESGRPTELYRTLRKALLPYSSTDSVPGLPPAPPMSSFGPITVHRSHSLFDYLDEGVTSEAPKSFEEMGQAYGYMLYEHIVESHISGIIRPGDRARDRVHVYVNDHLEGVIDSQYEWPRNVSVKLEQGDILKLLVENLGRVDYHSRETGYPNHLLDSYKGIVGDVTVDDEILEDWTTRPIPIDKLAAGPVTEHGEVQRSGDSPAFYTGHFNVTDNCQDPMSLDTFLAIPDGIRGVAFVNGFNLGRYWMVGPQQSLYLPGTLLHCDRPNSIVIFELSPQRVGDEMEVRGLSKREWFNQADPECEGCVPPPETKAPGQHTDE